MNSFKTDNCPGMTSPIARVELLDSFAAAEPVWRGLQADPETIFTPYQQFDFLRAWQHHVGAANGFSPLIVVGYDRLNNPVCLLPLASRTRMGARIAQFMGGKHANFNAPLWRREAVVSAHPDTMQPILDALTPFVDVLVLLNQPRFWAELPNPLTLLPHTESVDAVAVGTLSEDFEALLQTRTSAPKRKKIRNRERLLSRFGEIQLEQASNPEQVRVILAAFHQQRAQRFDQMGVANVFVRPGVSEFLEEALSNSQGNIELYALRVGDQIAATCAGLSCNGRFSTMFNSIASGEISNGSPGTVLLLALIEKLCHRGIQTFDLGIGEAQYKELICNDVDLLFDSFLPLTNAGRIAAAAMRAAYVAKRTVKRTPALWSAVQTARSLRNFAG